jgi:hypothetical protein
MNPPQTNAATPSTTTSTLRNFVPNPPPAFPCVKLTNVRNSYLLIYTCVIVYINYN